MEEKQTTIQDILNTINTNASIFQEKQAECNNVYIQLKKNTLALVENISAISQKNAELEKENAELKSKLEKSEKKPKK